MHASGVKIIIETILSVSTVLRLSNLEATLMEDYSLLQLLRRWSYISMTAEPSTYCGLCRSVF